MNKYPKSFCFNRSKIKAIVLGADPSNKSNRGNRVKLDYVFGIGSGDARYFNPILANLQMIGLSLYDVYVQNLVQDYLPDVTSENKDWEKMAEKWLPVLQRDLDNIDKHKKIPVLATAERIFNFLTGEKISVEEIYRNDKSDNYTIPISPQLNRLGRPLVPFYRHKKYSLLDKKNENYLNKLKKIFPVQRIFG